MKEYMKPEVELIEFVMENVANLGTSPGENDGNWT